MTTHGQMGHGKFGRSSTDSRITQAVATNEKGPDNQVRAFSYAAIMQVLQLPFSMVLLLRPAV